jgi:DNA processing protein
MKINQISPQDNAYLQILEHIANAPKLLNYIGKLPTERKPTVAIVGTRKPTAYGKDTTYRIAYELVQKGVVIVSGLALGVDALAHRAALEAGGTTIAVLGNGLPTIYPSSHRELARNIVAHHGLIMSEYDEDMPALPHQFLERNRIVSGLADAIIITEAAARSGTLNTAMHAMEQGKDVFVVPGNITSPMSLGCNSLLRQGAIPLLHSDDVLEAIAPRLLAPQNKLALGNTPTEVAVIEFLQAGGRDGDAMQQAIGTSATELSNALTMLEIAGTIRALGANQWTLR